MSDFNITQNLIIEANPKLIKTISHQCVTSQYANRENEVQVSQRNRESIGDLQSCDNFVTTHVLAPLDMDGTPFVLTFLMALNGPKNDNVPDEMYV